MEQLTEEMKMSWEGNYWGPKGALEEAKKKFASSEQTPSDMVAYASPLYSAAGRAIAECRASLKRFSLFEAVRWCIRAVVLGYKALQYVDDAWKRDVTWTDFTIDQIDVSFAVWLTFGGLKGGRKRRVRSLIREPLIASKSPDVKYHTCAFMTSHAIKCGFFRREPDWIFYIERMAREAEESGELAQASRVWKHVARHWKCLGERANTQSALVNANRLAARSSPDQVAKLQH